MDAGEFDRWYAGSYPRLVAQLTALIGNRAEAQDCVQEAFIRAWDKVPRLDSTGERDAWVRTTAYRLAVSRWRRVRRGRELSTRTAVTGYDALARSEVRADVLGALLRLPIDQRCVLVLHYFADRSVAQIAAETGAPEGTVKARLHRGRLALADILTQSAHGSIR